MLFQILHQFQITVQKLYQIDQFFAQRGKTYVRFVPLCHEPLEKPQIRQGIQSLYRS